MRFLKFIEGGFLHNRFYCLFLALCLQMIPLIAADRPTAIPVLVYHGIIKKEEPVVSNYDTGEETFKEHMEALKRAGYQTITLQDLLAFLKTGKALPEKPFLITFDDGRRDSLLVDPVLEKLGFTAVMFLITDPEQMTLSQRLKWDELNKMFQSKRWEMQAHGHFYHNLIPINEQGDRGHFASNKKWIAEKNRLENDLEYQQRLYDDLRLNKKEIETHMPGNKVISFAFPFGDFGNNGINVPDSYGIPINIHNTSKLFQLAFLIYPNILTSGTHDFMVRQNTNALLLPRFVDNGYRSGEEIVELFDKVAELK